MIFFKHKEDTNIKRAIYKESKPSKEKKNRVLTYDHDCRKCGKTFKYSFIEFKEPYLDVKCCYCGNINKIDTRIFWVF